MADDVLAGLAKKYLWWESGDGAEPPVRRLVAQIMNMGDFNDVQHVEATLGTDVFRDAIEHAEPGWFNPRSWSYWNHRLGLLRGGVILEAPKRRLP